MTSNQWWNSGAVPPKPQRKPRVPIPGLADWSLRAMATLLEISVAGGIATAYEFVLWLGRPFFALIEAAALLVGWHLNALFVDLYWMLGLGFLVWQSALRGATGQSLGQRLLGIATVDEDTGCPVGPARSLVRTALHVVDAVPGFFGYIRPVFHYNRQTIADTISRSVVVMRVAAEKPGRPNG